MKETKMKEIVLSIEESDILLEVLNRESWRLYRRAKADLKKQNIEISYKNLQGNFFMEKRDIIDDLWFKIFELQKTLKDTNI